MGWKRMFSRKKLPPFPHDFWLEEMEQARGDAEALPSRASHSDVAELLRGAILLGGRD